MKKTVILKDDIGHTVEVKLEKFVDHINRYHRIGTRFTMKEGITLRSTKHSEKN